ncbi:hypothetical protein [Fluviicola taffensis]|uniref:hypothetical protein n=1 Tax=Fluviicola taffensis TaxID=191579 RepID=UPI003137AE46
MNLRLEGFLAKKWMIFLLFASLIYLLGTKSDRRYGWTNEESRDGTPIVSDGAGYYGFLPYWFIHHADGFEFMTVINEKYPDDSFTDNLARLENQRLYDKYYTGTAQCLTPFFLIGHAHASMSGADLDGYSWPYQLWMDIGLLAYVLLGLVCLFFILRRLKLSYLSVYLSLIGLVVATNLSFYSYYDIPYSHVFSFAIVNAALLLWLKWIQDEKRSALVWFAFFLSLSIMIRPTNILIICVLPFFFESTKAFISNLKFIFQKPHLKIILAAIVLAIIPVLIQLLTTHAQTDKWSLNPYSDEGFDHWKDPYFWEILFGFRKGMFIYSPFLLLMIPGLIVCFFKARRLFFGILVFTVIATYVLSSWWCWWYGGSLGMRSMIDFYGIFVIPIAVLITHSTGFWKISLTLFIAGSTHLYQTYERQYDLHILHYDYMNYPMWKKILLKEEARLCYVFYSKIDTIPQTAVSVTGPMEGFLVKNEPLSANKVYGGHPDFLYPNSIGFGKKLGKVDPSAHFALQFSTDICLNKHDENVNFVAYYFKNDSLLGQSDVMVSSRPQNLKKWEFIQVDVVPDYRWGELDSIRCGFILSGDKARFKDLKVQLFKYK